jgi:hypothetical protein
MSFIYVRGYTHTYIHMYMHQHTHTQVYTLHAYIYLYYSLLNFSPCVAQFCEAQWKLSLTVGNGFLRSVFTSGCYVAHSHNAVHVAVGILSVVKLQRSDDDLICGQTMSRIVMGFTNTFH